MSETATTIRLGLGSRSYEIVVGGALLGQVGAQVRRVVGAQRCAVVTDETVARLHLDAVRRSCDAADLPHHAIVLPAGESTKDFATLERLLDDLLEARIERQDVLLALGGGVIGDVVGFAASVLRRGVPFVQIPTTLLAQVDSSVGGKTGINTRQGKNLVGAFYQPALVLADLDTLDTLPARQMRAGYAEIAKYGLIADRTFFDWLERHGKDVLAGDRDAQRHAVCTSCRIKADVVAGDERETGRRAILNFGHTFAHAIERVAGFGDAALHGEAVSVGMAMALDLSARLGLCPGQDVERARRHLDALGLPTALSDLGLACDAASLYGHMAQDKKVKNGRIVFVLLRGIGEPLLSADVPEADVLAVLGAAAARRSARAAS